MKTYTVNIQIDRYVWRGVNMYVDRHIAKKLRLSSFSVSNKKSGWVPGKIIFPPDSNITLQHLHGEEGHRHYPHPTLYLPHNIPGLTIYSILLQTDSSRFSDPYLYSKTSRYSLVCYSIWKCWHVFHIQRQIFKIPRFQIQILLLLFTSISIPSSYSHT